MSKKQTSSVIKKIVSYVPRSESEMKECVKATIAAQLECEKLIAERDKATLAAAEPFADRISALQTQQARNLELLEAYSEINREAFGKDKSIVIEGHRMGWKLGNWKTNLLKKTKWADVLCTLKEWAKGSTAEKKAAARYLRTKEEPAKDIMISDRDLENAKETLASLGVEIVQEETFYLAPDREGQEPAIMTAAD